MGFSKVPLTDVTDPASPKKANDALVETSVRCGRKDQHIKKGKSSRHMVQLKNLHTNGLRFVINSTHSSGPDVVYMPTPPDVWPVVVDVNGAADSRRSARWVQKTREVEHPGACAKGNSHTIALEVEVTSLVPGEALTFGTNTPYNYQFTCTC